MALVKIKKRGIVMATNDQNGSGECSKKLEESKEMTDGCEEKSEEGAEQSLSHLKWYIVHTYSGLENRAKKSLEERIRQRHMEAKFGEVLIPTETVEEVKGGVRKTQTRKCFPGYILVQMDLDEDSGHLVRNTPKITGFVGGSKAPPSLSETEVHRMRSMAQSTRKPKVTIEFNSGDQVRIIEGPFANFNGSVEDVKPDKQKLRVLVSIFGRLTPVELEFIQVEKLT